VHVALLKALFCERDFLQSQNLRFLIVLEGITFGETGLLVLSWWCLRYCYKELITVGGVFFFVILLPFFLAMRIRIAPRAYRGWV
jgi:hypothetical protein